MGETIDAVYEILVGEGFRPKRDDDNLVFKYEGDTFVVMFREKDPDFISLNKFISFDLDEDQLLELYQLCNEVCSDYILGRCTLKEDDDELTLMIEMNLLGSLADFEKNFNRYIRIMQGMEEDFTKGYKEIND